MLAAANNREGKDYKLFLQDLEEDKELRDQVNLYRDDDVMAELEARVAGMTLDDKAPAKGDRDIKKAVRRTEQGKMLQADAGVARGKS